MKKLFRSNSNKKIAGVCGGIAEYFAVDATLVRVIAVLVIVVSGGAPGLLAYVVLWVVMPPRPGRELAGKSDETAK